MLYHSVIDNHTVRKKTRAKRKGSRLRIAVFVVIQAVIVTALLGGLAWLVVSEAVLPPLVKLEPLVLNAPRSLVRWLSDWAGRVSSRSAAVVGGAGLLVWIIYGQLETLGWPRSFLRVADGAKYHYRESFAPFIHKPVRHFLLAALKTGVTILFTLLWLALVAVGWVYFRVIFLTTVRSAANAPILWVALVLYSVLAIGALLVLLIFLNWVRYGFAFLMYPTKDAAKLPLRQALAISWRLTRGNKWQLFYLKWRALFWPAFFMLVALALVAVFGERVLPATYQRWALCLIAGFGVFWLLWSRAFVHLAYAVLYRDLTGQYARRLTENYPKFEAEPKAGLMSPYHTEEHPRFSVEALKQAEFPDEDEATSGETKHAYVPLRERQETGDQEPIDPGVLLDKHQVTPPTPAHDIFNGEDERDTQDEMEDTDNE